MYDVCIVGAGVAGSTLGAYLGRNGLSVALVDKKWEQPDEIIGELLQPSGVEKISEMQMSEVFQGIDAQPINGYAIYLKDEPHQLSYPRDHQAKQVNGYGFRYGRFVNALRELSSTIEDVTHIKGSVNHLLEGTNGEIIGVRVETPGQPPGEIRARLTVVSQGSLSSMRGQLNRAQSEIKGYMLGIVLEDCELPFANHGHVIMADPAPILAYPVGRNKIRILIDFPRELPALKGEALKDHLRNKVGPQLPEVLRQAFDRAVDEGNFKGKATHLLASRPVLREGAVLLGDSLNMRHPTTGGGMTVALTDVKDLGDRLLSLSSFEAPMITAEVKKFYNKRYSENATVNILAYALYRVFRHEILRRACFEYLKRGGRFAAEPMSILSGISRSRTVLLKHFFAVAWLAIIQQLRPFPTPRRLGQSYRLVRDTLDIIVPLVRDEVPSVR